VSPALEAAARAARDWLTGAAAPLWCGAGFDASVGQFVEALDLDGEPLPGPRRTLVQARQMYLACVCGRLGWRGPWRERVAAAGEALLRRGRNAKGDWIYSFAADGGVADGRADLYTQAFVIFGLAQAGRALERADFLAAAEATARALDERWADPRGGYVEGEVAPLPRRQNPHMHLLEAYLALHAATGSAEHLRRAEAMADLFATRLRLAPGRLGEFFAADWRALEPAELSPGHHFEWAWLLHELKTSGGRDLSDEATALAAFAEALGVSAAGFVVDEVWQGGSVKLGTSRLWPQTERLKAALLRGDDDAALQSIAAINTYIDRAAPGTWTDTRLEDGTWETGPAPASSGYHLACAIESLVEAAGAGSA
jgi:mannose/cellobiose epimerase-like protein (N-acyl-D-glucosamine 2-epimerase family)